MFSSCCGCKRNPSLKNMIAINGNEDEKNITIKSTVGENSINDNAHDDGNTTLCDNNILIMPISLSLLDKQKKKYDEKKPNKNHNYNTDNDGDDDEFINGCRRIRLKGNSSLENHDDDEQIVKDNHKEEIQGDIQKNVPIINDDFNIDDIRRVVLEMKKDLEESCVVVEVPPPPITATIDNNMDVLNDDCHHHHNKQIDERKIIIKSCLSRRSSSKQRLLSMMDNNKYPSVNLSDIVDNTNNRQHENEINNNNNDDDEVFSDSIPAKLPRGDMCTPYPKKLLAGSSLQGLMILPDWFDDERKVGKLEPTVTPTPTPTIGIGRDELALKRYRLFTDLIAAAKAADEHHVRFDPFGPEFNFSDDIDCEPNLKPSVITSDLGHLVDRLEKIVDRLERSLASVKELDYTNNLSIAQLSQSSVNINQQTTQNIEIQNKKENDLNIIPTIIDYFCTSNDLLIETITNNRFTMSVNAYQDILSGSFSQYCATSEKIGGDVAQHSSLVKRAFEAQLRYVECATRYKEPTQAERTDLLKSTSDQIIAIQEFREKHRTSTFFNHLSAISESIPALGWVCVVPTPGPHVKEMNDAGQFYTNRVLKDWKEKDHTHVEWVRSWIQTLTELQQYIKLYHTTGLLWNGKVKYQATAGGIGKCLPPPPPPAMPPPPSFDDLSLNASGDERSALFAQINQGQDITKGLKKVTSDMQTHKNATLRTGPAPFKTPAGVSPSIGPTVTTAAVNKQPVFTRDGKKWIIEYQKSNPSLLVENAEKNNVVYIFKCENSTVTVKGKINTIVMDSCKKCSILFDDIVSSVEFVNCQSVQMQVFGNVPTVVIDKTDGCQMYLSDQSMAVHIISSKSSEMNVMIPKGGGEYAEQPVPEQFVTTIKGKTLNTVCADSLG